MLTWIMSRTLCRWRGHHWLRNKAIGAGAKQCSRCGLCETIKKRKRATP